jgi:2,4-dienoyl-CoA reductase-like NADH-dependent reductase (Old Yellow Enzyme family)/thioredoxin reductase
MAAQEFKHLFSPLRLGNVTLPNRIVMTGHINRLAGEQVRDYFVARARGGVGLIMSSPHHPFMTTDDMIPDLKKLADAVHQYPTKIFAQLFHIGGRAWARAMGGGAALAASPVKVIMPFVAGGQSVPRQMDRDDIRRTVKAYGETALRMKKAGYDGVEIMAAWGTLQAEFLSQVLNIRTDEYGGNLENRTRFLLECIDAIRENVGPDFPIGVRFNGDELVQRVWWTDKHGNTLDEAKEIAQRLEATGKLDYLFACADTLGAGHFAPMHFPLSSFVYLAAGLKEVVELPVVAVGRINDPVLAENILANNQADLIGMNRAVICDPEMPNKAREGRLEEIRRCIACNEGCVGPNFLILPIACSLNYETGREQMGPIEVAEVKKSVMVIGGGAAGLEAARVAALRGHKVDLYEKNDVLARELDIAAKAPGRQDFAEAKRYLTYQMKLLNVNVHLGVTVTPEMVVEQKPDAVIVATGGVPLIPEIPGAESGNVVATRQVLLDEVEVGQNVLIADYQNHMYGLDVADFLAERGKKIELITNAVFAGSEADATTIQMAYFSTLSRGVVITPLTSIKEIQGRTVIVYNVLTNAERQIEGIDSVVVCTDEKANDALYYSLKGQVKELYLIGQALSPRRLLDSIADAYVTARAL